VPESLIANVLSVLLGPLVWIGLTVLYQDRRDLGGSQLSRVEDGCPARSL
jgi:hypothetical protein